MRRTLFTVVLGVVAIAIVPASSLARDHGRGEHQRREREHQRREHRRHHERHHGIRHERIGHSPTAPGDESGAGKVASFTGGVLTVQLTDGSMVRGVVNDSTRIKCEAPDSTQMTGDDHGRDSGDDNGNDNGDENGAEQMCSTAALTPNTVVQEAELRISKAGATWDEVELGSQQPA